jgi:hypothetical protein
MVERTDLLFEEYGEINEHLRSNIGQFVNWFSFFLTFSFVVLALFVTSYRNWPELRHFFYAVLTVFLLLHILAFVAIVTFRRYIAVTDGRIKCISVEIAKDCESPVPVRFFKWMTDLMAAGFVISYFTWFSLLFIG